MSDQEELNYTEAIKETLLEQRENRVERGFYWENQIAFAYNSQKIEGSLLTEEQTRSIFETGTVSGIDIPIDHITEMRNHFRMFDYALDTLNDPISVELMQALHRILKTGTADDISNRQFVVGGWKTVPNSVAGIQTASPQEVDRAIQLLLEAYQKATPCLENVVAFHWRFETIHPFQDGNGRVGRMLMFRECLRNGISPFIVLDSEKGDYYEGLRLFHEGDRGPLVRFCERMAEVYFKEFSALVPRNLLLPSLVHEVEKRESFELDVNPFTGCSDGPGGSSAQASS